MITLLSKLDNKTLIPKGHNQSNKRTNEFYKKMKQFHPGHTINRKVMKNCKDTKT